MTIREKIIRLLDINSYRHIYKYIEAHRTAVFLIVLLNTGALLLETVLALISKWVVDEAMTGSFRIAIYYSLLFVVTFMIEILLMNISSYYTVHAAEKIRIELQQRLLGNIYHKKWLEISDFQTGDLLTRIYDDIQNIVTTITSIIPTIVSMLFQLIAAFSILAYYDPTLAILAFTITPFTVLVGMIIGQRTKAIQHKIQAAASEQRSLINESLQNQLILKVYEYLDHNLEKIQHKQEKQVAYIKERTVFRIKSSTIIRMGSGFGFFFTLIIGAYRLSMGAITFGTFTAFMQLIEQIQSPIRRLSQQIPQLVSSISSMERIEYVESLENELPVSHDLTATPKKIQIDNLCFSYAKDKPILRNLSFDINQGDRIAVIGPSGKGKTTLIHVLLGLMPPEEGQCLMTLSNGEKINLSPTTRSFFSYVPQTNTLFSGSIRDNFFIDDTITDEAINNALEAVCANDFIEALPEGIHTLIHEKGLDLSQGQGQRLTIARALLDNAPILLFDEATSALDLQTEEALLNNIVNMYPDKTLIAVTHKDTILKHCNKSIQI